MSMGGGITRDLGLKLFSLTAAVLLFVFVTVESRGTLDVAYPLEYRTGTDVALVGEYPSIVSVSLTGPWAGVWTYDVEHLTPIVVDLRGAHAGPLRHRIEHKDVRPPAGLSVVALRPAELALTLDRVSERTIPVQVELGAEEPATGFEVASIEVSPSRVRVSGPYAELKRIDSIATDSVSVAGVDRDVEQTVPLRTPVGPYALREKEARVIVRLREKLVERTLLVPVEARGVPSGFSVEVAPESVRLELRGPQRVIDRLERGALKAFVDVSREAVAGPQQLPKAIELEGLPDRAALSGLMPRVEVRIQRSKKK